MRSGRWAWQNTQVAKLMAVLPFSFQVAIPPYAPEPGSECQPREYYDKTAQSCCSMCPPGEGQPPGPDPQTGWVSGV